MRIVIIGDGNVSWHFAKRLLASDSIQLTIHSRKALNSSWGELNGFQHSESTITSESIDLIILAIADQAIAEVASSYRFPDNAIVVHTAGSVPVSILNSFTNYGVIYPLQSLRAGFEVEELPILIEASSPKVLEQISKVAYLITSTVQGANSEQRKQLHLAAVFASNFVNHLLAIVEKLSQERQLDADLLRPLVKETVRKAFEMGAKNAQTGPAKRQDQATMDAHMELLNHAYEKQVYALLSQGIVSYQENE